MPEKPILTDLPLVWLNAAIRTIEAPRWKLWCARWFGRRFSGEDYQRGHRIVGHEWRGKLYFTNYEPLEH